MKLVHNYMKDESLRHKLNTLTRATFGFDFESWVVNGYYEGDYIPYSYEDNDKFVSNVSANIMKFNQNGKDRMYIQIGTVMTDVAYRNQGLASKLMKYVIDEYKDKCDGIYLFGDLSAVEFYKKLGFCEMKQYEYILKDDISMKADKDNNVQNAGFAAVDSVDEAAKKAYIDCVKNEAINSAFEQVNKFGLQMFYTADMDDIYYSKNLDCYIAMYKEGDFLEIQSVISKKDVSLRDVINELNYNDFKFKKLKVGFTPKKEDVELFEAVEFDGGDDYRLFAMGEKLGSLEEEKLYFPAFSHA